VCHNLISSRGPVTADDTFKLRTSRKYALAMPDNGGFHAGERALQRSLKCMHHTSPPPRAPGTQSAPLCTGT
jgi:hypothetical protein